MEIVFLFYNGMTALDAAGPHEILCRLPNAVDRVGGASRLRPLTPPYVRCRIRRF